MNILHFYLSFVCRIVIKVVFMYQLVVYLEQVLIFVEDGSIVKMLDGYVLW